MRDWCMRTQSFSTYTSWDSEVLDTYIQEAVYETEQGTVRLKVSPYFVRWPFYLYPLGGHVEWRPIPM